MTILAREYRLLLAMALSLALPACAAPLTYSAIDIHGQVVDAETNQPIEGAVVVAQWVLFRIGVGHGGHDGRIHLDETVTDKEGRYVIPAWGPKPRPPMTELHERDPEILIFKGGYEPVSLRNFVVREGAMRVSNWNWKVIKLKRPTGSVNDRAFRLGSFYGGLVNDQRDMSEWKHYPRMLMAVYEEKQRLRASGLTRGYASSIPEVHHFDAKDQEYLRRFSR